MPSSQASSVAIGPRAPPRHSQTHESAGGRFRLVQAPQLRYQGEAAACPSGRTAGRWVWPITMNGTSARSATSRRSMPRAASMRHSSTVAGVAGSTGVRVGTRARARRARRRSMRRPTLGRPASERRWMPRRVATSRPLGPRLRGQDLVAVPGGGGPAAQPRLPQRRARGRGDQGPEALQAEDEAAAAGGGVVDGEQRAERVLDLRAGPPRGQERREGVEVVVLAAVLGVHNAGDVQDEGRTSMRAAIA